MELIREKIGESRKYIRIPVKFEVFSRDTGRLIGKAVNLSMNGMLIETESPLKPGTKLLLEFKLPDQVLPIKAYSDVKWVKKIPDAESKSSVMGLQFINIYEADRKKLEEYEEQQLKKINSDNLSLADFIDISNKDLFAKTRIFWEAINDLTNKGFNMYGMPLLSGSKNRVLVLDKKTRREREVIMMSTSNYLGLASHPRVIDAAKKAIQRYGIGTGSVSLLSGTYDLHRRLESKLAEVKGCEDALIFPSGHMANMGGISALLGKKDVAIIDKMVHVSILDGCMLGGGSFRTFRHSDPGHLRAVLECIDSNHAGRLIIVEGVYGLDGDIVPLPEIVEIAREFGAKVMVDDAHATGTIGNRGRGTASYFGMEGKVDIVMDSLSKALGGLGGYIASSKEVINYLKFYARPSMFSVSAPPVLMASALAAIQVMESEPALTEGLWENIKYMKENLQLLGFNNVDKSESAIISTIIGNELTLRQMNRRIFEEGVYVEAISYPAVPRGQERLRLRIMSTHTKKDLDKTLEVLGKVGKEFGVLKKSGSVISFESERKSRRSFMGKREIEVAEVTSRKGIADSVKFSWEVYKNHPEWVPYFLINDRINLLCGDYLYFRNNVKTKRFIAKENGNLVGAVSAFVDERFLKCWSQKIGFLGFFEALPGYDIAVCSLLDSALDFLKLQGMEEVWAPVNIPFPFYGGGLLSSGFDRTPSFLQPYSPPYYRNYFSNFGFGALKRLPHYSIDLSSPENISRIYSTVRGSSVTLRELDKSEYEEEALTVLRIYNESFPRLWKYTTFENDEFIEFARDLRDLLINGLWLIAEAGGESAGFIGAFPQCAQLFKTINGELGSSELFTIPNELERIKEGAIVLLGVLDKYKDMEMGVELIAHLCANMIGKGYRRTTCTWEISDGRDINQVMKRLGGVKDDLEWIIYGKSLK